ncbi:hypothetical protein [uncultured Maritimibacter sp.]|jgi:hypothetical protein|uniref:hypothetical protein n=1 Tax=uncultured Maritimibacter sp. TaxID=991866 RepID=UPI000AD19A84|nr:hypothetical protein [uncultured Maritimibacter sp.]
MRAVLKSGGVSAVVFAALFGAGTAKAQTFDSDIQTQLSQFAGRGTEVRFSGYLTGYSYWDNTPPGSAAIARPVIHRTAGGTGTYEDPITIAVGHSIIGGRQTLDFPAGTRFYIERLRKYAIVEDVCGDGARPQDGPCHTGHNGLPWLDIYIGGENSSVSATNQCMNRLTGVQAMMLNPRRGYPVVAGAIADDCTIYGPIS